ncbi:RDD family protein [Mesocricetibacter intestinalis]|uniref:RDD family protein n=1 Tax=Mesocricetibacter intestinalis TaxID=1521930 RepID=A0A4R6VBP7_9PAST|nr:RDD family protein [Mesocricetibacter intestinalis]TDQ59708.1 RDD family protein [Mesocricetibacter intestinalis]
MLVENPNEKPQHKPPQYNPPNADASVPDNFANPFKRWGASLLNALVFYIMLFLGALLGKLGAWLAVIAFFILQIYYMRNYNQTFAKNKLNLQVLDYATRRPIAFPRYLFRELLDVIFSLLSLPILISAVIAFVSKEKRSLTDMIMSTIVVNKNSL